jgi:hypothetical protein
MRNIPLIIAIVLITVVVYAFRLLMLTAGCLLYAYLLPGVIAEKRNHPLKNEIYMICGLSGWLVIPWLGTLWLALRSVPANDLASEPQLVGNALDQ